MSMTTPELTGDCPLSTIDTRITGRQTQNSKPVWVTPKLHQVLKREAVERETTLGEATHIAVCRGLNIDPVTLMPIAVMS